MLQNSCTLLNYHFRPDTCLSMGNLPLEDTKPFQLTQMVPQVNQEAPLHPHQPLAVTSSSSTSSSSCSPTMSTTNPLQAQVGLLQLPTSPIPQNVLLANSVTQGNTSSHPSPDQTSSSNNQSIPKVSKAGNKRKRKREDLDEGSEDSFESKKCVTKRKKPSNAEELLVQRTQANDRERQRTKSLNDAFAQLREIVPTMPSDKLSKIQTLRLASNYVDFLVKVLENNDPQVGGNSGGVSGFSPEAKEALSYAFNLWRMERVCRSSSSPSSFDH